MKEQIVVRTRYDAIDGLRTFSAIGIILLHVLANGGYVLQNAQRTPVLYNPFATFLSGISMEVYLSHMVIFRGLEKLGMTKLLSSDLLSYLVTSVATVAGTIVFDLIVGKCLEMIRKYRKTFQKEG